MLLKGVLFPLERNKGRSVTDVRSARLQTHSHVPWGRRVQLLSAYSMRGRWRGQDSGKPYGGVEGRAVHWRVSLGLDVSVRDVPVFTKNLDCLLETAAWPIKALP